MNYSVKTILELDDQVGTTVNKNLYPLVIEVDGYENLTFGERSVKIILIKLDD